VLEGFLVGIIDASLLRKAMQSCSGVDTRAHTLSSKRKGPFDGFEVWDRARFVFRRPPSAETLGADPPRALGTDDG
jgi:hypothetical protein